VENGARIVEQDVGIEDEVLPHRNAGMGITGGALVAA
jgi:hypothetical protein